VLRATFGSQAWRSRSQHNLEAKSCPGRDFVIWSQILQLFHINDHQNEMTCRARDLGRYLEGQYDLPAKSCPAHNFVIWSLILQLYHQNDHHILTTCRAQHLGRYVEGQGHSMTLQRNRFRPITSLFEDWFYNYFTEMITILRRRVARNIWVATLKVKVTAWPCTKIMSGP
jgi:hypothetical protein